MQTIAKEDDLEITDKMALVIHRKLPLSSLEPYEAKYLVAAAKAELKRRRQVTTQSAARFEQIVNSDIRIGASRIKVNSSERRKP